MTLSTIFLKTFKLSALATALTLAGCGGGGGNDTVQPPADSGTGNTNNPTTGSDGTAQAYKFFVTQSKSELRTGSDTLTLGIRVTDASGGIKANVPVSLQLLDNGTNFGLSFDKSSQLVTDANGYVEVNLLQSDIGLVSKLDHTATVKVTVTNGSVKSEETLTIPVTGTTIKDVISSRAALAADDTATVTGTLVDGGSKPIANTKVELLNESVPLATPQIVTTDSAGRFSFTVSQSLLGQANNDTYNLSVQVKGVDKNNNPIRSSPISFTQLTRIAPNLVNLRVTDATGTLLNNNEILVGSNATLEISTPNIADGQTVYLSTNKGTLTGSNGSGTRVTGVVQGGKVRFNINSNVPNTAQLTLEQNGVTLRQFMISFISQDVQKLLLQVENTTATTNGQTNVVATVKDSRDIPIKNAIVEFSIISDASGGSLNTAVVRTDENGQAITGYFAGGIATANNGVKIGATVKAVSFNGRELAIAMPKTAQATLTVQSQSTFIGYAFADKIISSTDHIYYIQNGSIFVNNNIGQPAANQDVSISVIPHQFYRGEYYVAKDMDNKLFWAIRSLDANNNVLGKITCDNEDSNFNGILDSGEDSDKNGKLDPINPITVLSANGQVAINGQTMRTDSTGKLDFSIRYGKEYANWMTATIKVTTLVNGSEYVSYRNVSLPTLVDDVVLSETNAQRPNWESPFGLIFNGYDATRSSKYKYCQ